MSKSRLSYILLVSILLIQSFMVASPATSASAAVTAWEQVISPLGSGFESTYVGGWVLIRTQNTVNCSIDANNAIYTRTRTVGYTNDSDWARWRPTLPATAFYRVYVYIPKYTHSANVTDQARYHIRRSDGEELAVVTINQNNNLCGWVDIGEYWLNAGTGGYVYMGDYTGENPTRLIAADGVKFVLQNRPPSTPILVSPSDGAAAASPSVTLQIQDTGDIDNYLRTYRDFCYRVENVAGTWGLDNCWTTNTSWSVTVPASGSYRWRVQSGDGELPSTWSVWRSFSYNAPPAPILTRSRLYEDTRKYLGLEFCGTNIHQDVYIGSKRAGRDFGVHAMRVDFGATEQCAVDDNLADGPVLRSTTYYSGVALNSQDVYAICGSASSRCDNIAISPAEPVIPPIPPVPLPSTCPVPFYWQSDPRWSGNKFGTCSCTIGSCGCALTSVAMTFKYYGVNRDPASLAQCLGNRACPLYWTNSCSDNKVSFNGWVSFNWTKLESELKQNRPVVLQLNRNGGMHFVVAVSGSGNTAQGYLVNDPALKQGTRVKLSDVLARRNYWPVSMRLYSGTPSCPASDVNNTDVFKPTFTLSAAQPITGSATVYRNTETTMTFELAAQSLNGTVTEMLIWTDLISNATWQPFAEYVELPLSEQFFIKFRDSVGTESETINTSSDPVTSPPDLKSILLPITIK
jgi:hypothetical protein